jgi:hypothetical protein
MGAHFDSVSMKLAFYSSYFPGLTQCDILLYSRNLNQYQRINLMTCCGAQNRLSECFSGRVAALGASDRKGTALNGTACNEKQLGPT